MCVMFPYANMPDCAVCLYSEEPAAFARIPSAGVHSLPIPVSLASISLDSLCTVITLLYFDIPCSLTAPLIWEAAGESVVAI